MSNSNVVRTKYDGSIYEGTQKDGKVFFQAPDGTSYEGEYSMGKMEGHGKFHAEIRDWEREKT